MAVRAVAVLASAWWGGRPHRHVSFDAWWADGRVETGASLSSVMQLRHPADIADAEKALHDRCPEVGPGDWCDDRGRLVDGLAVGSPWVSPKPRPRGERWEFGAPRYEPTKKPRRAVRLVAGLVALVLGVVLLAATQGDGPLALVGLICLGPAVGALFDFVPRRRRWW